MLAKIFFEWLIPFLCGGAVSVAAAAWTAARKAHKKSCALDLGVQCLLRAEIIRSYDKYSDRGYCPLYAKEALTRAYDSYHGLGGNDVATKLYEEMMKLPNE